MTKAFSAFSYMALVLGSIALLTPPAFAARHCSKDKTICIVIVGQGGKCKKTQEGSTEVWTCGA
jgi:hypothetical protein